MKNIHFDIEKRPVFLQMLELLILAAETSIAWQKDDGSMPAGHNGPYHDPETPVRNTAHWGITFQAVWEITGDYKFLDAAIACAEYLLNSVTPQTPFYCRNKLNKDQTNGLIGQAWAMEALLEIGVRQNRSDLINLAESVFNLHPFMIREGGWLTVRLDGSPSRLDQTFNHQLWFCAIGVMLLTSGRESASESVEAFLGRLSSHLRLYPNGLIRHLSPQFLSISLYDKSKGLIRALRNFRQREQLYIKSVGYHTFNTYAFSLIQRSLPATGLNSTKIISRALEYLVDGTFENEVDISPYGYPYNPPGFEAAMSIATFFPEQPRLVDIWLERQITKTYNQSTKQFDRDAADPLTSAARIYEVTRIYSKPWAVN